MSLSLIAAWRAIDLALAWAILLQSIELLRLREAWGEHGIWRWKWLSREYPRGLAVLVGSALSSRAFEGLLYARSAAAVVLGTLAVLHVEIPLLLTAFLFVSTLAIVLRFRGPFNGGSDAMTLMMLIGAGVPSLAPGVKWVARAGLAWIAVNVIASYVLSGLAKLREPDWRNGRTLGHVLRSPHYGVPVHVARALDGPVKCAALSWGIMLFELGFPLAFSGPRACLAIVGAGVLFHALNARLLGLSRFFWIWPVAYPAIVYWVP